MDGLIFQFQSRSKQPNHWAEPVKILDISFLRGKFAQTCTVRSLLFSSKGDIYRFTIRSSWYEYIIGWCYLTGIYESSTGISFEIQRSVSLRLE